MSHIAAFTLYVKASCATLGVVNPHVEVRTLEWNISAQATTDGYGPVVYVDQRKLGWEDLERLAWHECVHFKLRHHEMPLTPKQQHGEDFKALMATFKKRRK